jgi:hypothetical protein
VLAQPAEEPEEVNVRGETLSQLRLEVEQARDEMVELFNEANQDDDTDIRCRSERPTGSRIPQKVCWSKAQERASAQGAGGFLDGLMGLGSAAGAESGMAAGQEAAVDGNRAAGQFEGEWQRVLGANQEFRDAVVKYRELQDEFNRTTGATIRMPVPSFTLRAPQCEASTYTEYEQMGNVARVSGRVAISACPAGTAGKFTVVARVKDDAGGITPIEFSAAWQLDDSQDYVFTSDYPIGDNVFLESLRVRNLTCTCEGPAQ